MKFECDRCGCCCRAAKCGLLKGNDCSIYDKRPDVCKVEVMHQYLGISRELSYKLNKEYCRKLQAGR